MAGGTGPDTGRDEIVLTARGPFQGARVANISPAVADELRIEADTKGVVVTELADGASAARAHPISASATARNAGSAIGSLATLPAALGPALKTASV